MGCGSGSQERSQGRRTSPKGIRRSDKVSVQANGRTLVGIYGSVFAAGLVPQFVSSELRTVFAMMDQPIWIGPLPSHLNRLTV